MSPSPIHCADSKQGKTGQHRIENPTNLICKVSPSVQGMQLCKCNRLDFREDRRRIERFPVFLDVSGMTIDCLHFDKAPFSFFGSLSFLVKFEDSEA